jgi:RecA-family ATPase
LDNVLLLVFSGVLEEEADFERLETEILKCRPDVLVIDPIISKLGSATNPNAAGDVRRVLKRLSFLAQYYQMSIVIVRHLNKSQGQSLQYRGQGSVDFVGAARSVLYVAKHPQNPKSCVVIHTKASATEKGRSLEYRIDNQGFHLLGACDVKQEDLEGFHSQGEREKSQEELDTAVAFIESELKNGPIPTKDLEEGASAMMISKATLKRARTQLKGRISIKREGEKGKKGGGQVLLELLPEIKLPESQKQMSQELVNDQINYPLAHEQGSLLGIEGRQSE